MSLCRDTSLPEWVDPLGECRMPFAFANDEARSPLRAFAKVTGALRLRLHGRNQYLVRPACLLLSCRSASA